MKTTQLSIKTETLQQLATSVKIGLGILSIKMFNQNMRESLYIGKILEKDKEYANRIIADLSKLIEDSPIVADCSIQSVLQFFLKEGKFV